MLARHEHETQPSDRDHDLRAWRPLPGAHAAEGGGCPVLISSEPWCVVYAEGSAGARVCEAGRCLSLLGLHFPSLSHILDYK